MDLLDSYFELSASQLQLFAGLEPLYREWNERINVVSRRDIDALYEHHVMHSLAIAKAVQFVPGSQVADLGTGGGFPGLPLAILFPNTTFTLVDSIGKKLKVIDAICENLHIPNVRTVHSRFENLDGQYEFVVSRAVARLDTAWQWSRPLISNKGRHEVPNGLLYLKGGDIRHELPSGVYMKRWELSEWYKEAYFSEKALLLISEQRI